MSLDDLINEILGKRASAEMSEPRWLERGQNLTLAGWKAVLARAERGQVTRLFCEAVGGEFAVGPRTDSVKDVPCFTPAEIRAMCARNYTPEQAAQAYRLKQQFPGAMLDDAIKKEGGDR